MDRQVVEVFGAVDVVEPFAEAVDEDAWPGGGDAQVGVGEVVAVEGEEGGVVLRILEQRLGEAGVFATTDMLTGRGVDLGLTEELAGRLGDAPQQNGAGGGDGHVDAVFDRSENGDEDAREEDDDLEWGGEPELVDFPGRRDQVADGVDDHGREGAVGDVEKDGGESIEGEQDEYGGEDTRERGADPGFGLDGGSGEGAGSRVAAEERTEEVGEANGDKFLGRVDDVVVDATERLGDGNVLDQ